MRVGRECSGAACRPRARSSAVSGRKEAGSQRPPVPRGSYRSLGRCRAAGFSPRSLSGRGRGGVVARSDARTDRSFPAERVGVWPPGAPVGHRSIHDRRRRGGVRPVARNRRPGAARVGRQRFRRLRDRRSGDVGRLRPGRRRDRGRGGEPVAPGHCRAVPSRGDPGRARRPSGAVPTVRCGAMRHRPRRGGGNRGARVCRSGQGPGTQLHAPYSPDTGRAARPIR